MRTFHFPETDRMPERPALPVPDYHALNEAFHRALLDPKNQVLRRAENGHPIFGAYIGSTSNEMVTWGILAVGEFLSGRDPGWISPTYPDFFSQRFGLYLNNPGARRTEHWYLFYVNTLAGAVQRTLFPGDAAARARMGRSADAMLNMARTLDYDFNQQGFSFDLNQPFTHKDIYRQPDSIAGFGYNMLFAALRADRPAYLAESAAALQRYLAFPENPWYEIPNGSAGLMAAAWLNAHGHPMDVRRAAAWVFDHEKGPLQTGQWGGEEIDGLMMGWRGDTRQLAMSTAYSMETLMPLQFLLPAVRWAPELAQAVARHVRCVLSNFQLFYARGVRPLYETRPDLDPSIPYERLSRERDGHSPAACGDFAGHRSVYGAGYLDWLEAMARPTENPDIFALDLSLTDWLAEEKYPVFLLRNPLPDPAEVSFTPAPVWEKLRPELYSASRLRAQAYDLTEQKALGDARGSVRVSLPGKGLRLIALLPVGQSVTAEAGLLRCGAAELCAEGGESY